MKATTIKPAKTFDETGSLEIIAKLIYRHKFYLMTLAFVLSNTLWLVKG